MRPSSSLRIGDRTITISTDALLSAEYVLFDPKEIVHATDGEYGYLTSAKKARARLEERGVTVELARAAASALARDAIAAHARGECVREVQDDLGPYELFDGRCFTNGAYEGRWIDLRALACEIDIAPECLQALHLVTALERDDDVVQLVTHEWMSTREGETSFRDVDLSSASDIPDRVARLSIDREEALLCAADEAMLRDALETHVRERIAAGAPDRGRLEAIARTLRRDRAVTLHLAEDRIEGAWAAIGSGRAKTSTALSRRVASDHDVPLDVRKQALRAWLEAAAPTRPVVRPDPEIVEALAWPTGSDDESVSTDVLPTNVLAARTLFTRLARDVGREYKELYRATIKTDVFAIHLLQKHLRSAKEPRELLILRHGALLSEILARMIGAEWADIGPSEIGYWTMRTPSGTTTCPFGRVHRFLDLGHRARDLVDHFLALDAAR